MLRTRLLYVSLLLILILSNASFVSAQNSTPPDELLPRGVKKVVIVDHPNATLSTYLLEPGTDKAVAIQAIEKILVTKEASVSGHVRPMAGCYDMHYSSSGGVQPYGDGEVRAVYNEHLAHACTDVPGTLTASGTSYAWWDGSNPMDATNRRLLERWTFNGISITVSASGTGFSTSSTTVNYDSGDQGSGWVLDLTFNNVQGRSYILISGMRDSITANYTFGSNLISTTGEGGVLLW